MSNKQTQGYGEAFIPQFPDGDVAPPELDHSSFMTPQDEYHGVYLSFMLLGLGLLFPWNMVLSSADFFAFQFPDDKKLMFNFTIAYQAANLTGLCFVLNWGDRLSFRTRIVWGFAAFVVLASALPFLPTPALAYTCSACLGLADSIVQGTLFAYAGLFHSKYVTALMTGQGWSAVLVIILKIISKATGSTDEKGTRQSTYIFFAISDVVVILSVFVYLRVLERSPITKHYLNKTPQELATQPRFATLPVSLSPLDYAIQQAGGSADGSLGAKAAAALAKKQGGGAADPNLFKTAPSSLSVPSSSVQQKPTAASNTPEFSYLVVFKKITSPALVVMLNFLVTLAIFPGLSLQIKSTNNKLNIYDKDTNPEGESWWPLIILSLFDIGDLIGRTLPAYPKLIISDKNGNISNMFCNWAAVLRFGFFPFVYFILHDKLTGDVWAYIFMLTFAISNGYLSTLAMGSGNMACAAHEKERAGTLMIFFLTIGLTVGAISGSFVEELYSHL